MAARKKNEPSDEDEGGLAEAMADIHRRFGASSIIRMGDEPDRSIEALPTGVLTLDLALGIGGLPRGRIIEISGAESSGKSTLAYHVMAETQANGGTCALIDAEHALSPEYMGIIGMDMKNLLLSQPGFGEEALEIVESLTRSKDVDLIVIDSVAALTPRAEIEGEMGDANVGLQARLMSQAMRKLAGIVSKTDTTLIFINQLREQIGGWSPSGQVPTTTPGGRALKFYASVRLTTSGKQKREGTTVIGTESKARIIKNKAGGVPFQVAEYDIIYGLGINRAKAAIEAAAEIGVLPHKGAWYYIEDHKFNGTAQVEKWLNAEPARLADLMKQTSHALLTGEKPNVVTPEDDD